MLSTVVNVGNAILSGYVDPAGASSTDPSHASVHYFGFDNLVLPDNSVVANASSYNGAEFIFKYNGVWQSVVFASNFG